MGKTVLVLGAGASKASKFQLPTMEGFFGISIDQLPAELKDLLVWFYPKKSPREYNLEEVLSFLFTSYVRQPPSPHTSSDVTPPFSYGYRRLLSFVEQRLGILPTETCDQHVPLFQELDPLDTILTVNYDLVADQSLKYVERKDEASHSIPHTVGDLKPHSRMYKLANILGPPRYIGTEPPALNPDEQETGFYIKLHGSLDWIWCPNQKCSNSRRFYCVGIEPFKAGQEAGKVCRLCGTSLMAFLVPPVATKSLETEGILANLWNLALRELREAERLVIIGLSFAPSDQEIRWLIRQSNAMRSTPVRVCIINPSQKDRDTAKSLFPAGSRIQEFKLLDDYFEGRSDRV